MATISVKLKIIADQDTKEKVMESTLEKIMDTMSTKGVSAYKMEKYLNIPRGSFSSWKRGMGELYYSYVDKIADKL